MRAKKRENGKIVFANVEAAASWICDMTAHKSVGKTYTT